MLAIIVPLLSKIVLFGNNSLMNALINNVMSYPSAGDHFPGVIVNLGLDVWTLRC